jgi:cytochrome c-type biogenesis protein CcmE
MKKYILFSIVLILVGVGVLLSTLNKTATYAGFEEAAAAPGKEFHVVGKWNREKALIYNPEINPNLVEFFMTDAKGSEKKVILHKAMPPDFDKSEQIVLVGEMKEGVFHANDILLKCPSKYNEPPNSNNTAP